MRNASLATLLGVLALGLAACGGTVIDANSSPTPATAALPSGSPPAAAPSAPACTGSDSSAPLGQADTFAEGKDAPAKTTADGLQYVDLTVGSGLPVKAGQCVTMHYSLFLSDGTAIESSRKAGGSGAFKFQAGGGGVIKGFDEGVVGMNVGGRRRLTVPPALGYGAQGQGNIPANSTLVFVIEVVNAG
jgi:FKBP-type peptidyl-prolyl cis-trans isomerase FkpA